MESQTAVFDPKIVAFCCEQSGIFAAEMADALQRELPDNLEIVTVPCAGRIETIFLLKALETHADGVLVFACHEENCQYLRGNIRAKSRLLYAQGMLEKIGLEKGRLEICNLATNSGTKFIEVVKKKVEQLRELGPTQFSRKADI
jgi:F420-non-reducing hydrogenase iron-sulfur subunit